MILVNESPKDFFSGPLDDLPQDMCFEIQFIIYIATITWSNFFIFQLEQF